MRKLPSLNALRAFEATARLESVTRAATDLGVSHSAVSQHIRKLEEYLGQPLFLRNGRRVEPTGPAEILLGELSTAFDRMEFAINRFAARPESTEITVNSTPSFAMRWLIPKSSTYQIDNPGVKVIVETSVSDGIDHLPRHYDFIFRRTPMTRNGHLCLKILEDHSTALVSPSLAANIPCNSPKDMRRGVLLHLKSRMDAWRDWFTTCGVPTDETPSGPYYEHFFLSLQAAISGLGIAIGPLCFVEDDLRAQRLIAPFPEHMLVGPGFHVMYPATVMRSRHHRAFLNALIEAAKSSAGHSVNSPISAR